MAGFVDAVEVDILDGVFGGWAGYTNLFVGLSTTVPNDDGTGFTEATGASYARVSTASADWAAAAAGAPTTKPNANPVTFVTATEDWSTGANMVAFGLFDALTVGNLVATGLIVDGVGTPAPKPVLNGDTAEFAIGALVLRLGDPGDF